MLLANLQINCSSFQQLWVLHNTQRIWFHTARRWTNQSAKSQHLRIDRIVTEMSNSFEKTVKAQQREPAQSQMPDVQTRMMLFHSLTSQQLRVMSTQDFWSRGICRCMQILRLQNDFPLLDHHLSSATLSCCSPFCCLNRSMSQMILGSDAGSD